MRNVTGKRKSTSMVSAIDNPGKMRWMVHEGAMNTDLFLTFLKRLVRDPVRCSCEDNLNVYQSKGFSDWLEENRLLKELYYLPAFSPELNPDEYEL